MRGILKNSPPVFHMSTRWKKRVLEESNIPKWWNSNYTKCGSLGTRFFISSWSKNIDPRLRSTIRSLQQIAVYHKRMGYVSARAVMPIENDFLLLIAHQLLSMVFDGTSAHYHLQETLRLSTLLYSTIRIWALKEVACVSVFVNILRRILEPSFPVLRRTASDLLFWILFIGGLASQGFESHAWFVARCAEITEELSLKDWDSAALVLQGFFFVYQSTDSATQNLWNEVLSILNQG